MRFDLDEDQKLLRDSAAELLAKEAPLDASRSIMEGEPSGYSPDLFRQFGQLGYFGLPLMPASEDGSVGYVGLTSVLEEIGRGGVPGPFLEQLYAIEILRRMPGDLAASWLERAAAGSVFVGVARCESPTGIQNGPPQATFASGRVSGVKHFVPFGAHADALVIETAQGIVLAEKPAGGWDATGVETIDLSQRYAEIRLDGAAELLADGQTACAALEESDRAGALGASGVLLGLAAQALHLTREYIVGREAFGRPIGALQALQHRAADMLIRAENTRAAVYRAAWAMDHDPEAAPLLVAAAKAYAGDAARFVCSEAIQLHGGVGFTWEYDPHIYYKRVKTLEQAYGSTREQLERALAAAGIEA